MKFRSRVPLAEDKFYKDSKWSLFGELSGRAYLYGHFSSFLLPIFVLFIWWSIFGLNLEQAIIVERELEILWKILSLTLIALLHEFLHMITFPDFGISSKTTIVIIPKKLVALAYYTGEMTKTRCVMCLLAPFVVLSLMPLILCTYEFNYYIFFLAILNASLSGMDVLSAFSVYVNMPKESIVKNCGYQSYYRNGKD